jgi:alpha-mannosidase
LGALRDLRQKWVDLSEGGYGVSLLNDCKYGHDILGNVMRISLLRGPTMPDPQADQGEHQFVCRLFPHQGRWNESTVAAAYAFNDPLLAVDGRTFVKNNLEDKRADSVDSVSYVQTDSRNIVIETIKQAEDGNGIIVRMYECLRVRGQVTLTTGFDLKEAWKVNLLEENQSSIPVVGSKVQFDVYPYEIITLRLVSAAV